jgi:hypothetical protein
MKSSTAYESPASRSPRTSTSEPASSTRSLSHVAIGPACRRRAHGAFRLETNRSSAASATASNERARLGPRTRRPPADDKEHSSPWPRFRVSAKALRFSRVGTADRGAGGCAFFRLPAGDEGRGRSPCRSDLGGRIRARRFPWIGRRLDGPSVTRARGGEWVCLAACVVLCIHGRGAPVLPMGRPPAAADLSPPDAGQEPASAPEVLAGVLEPAATAFDGADPPDRGALISDRYVLGSGALATADAAGVDGGVVACDGCWW